MVRNFTSKKVASYLVTVLGASFFLFFASFASVRAQTAAPQLLLTWKASGSYVPAFYPDKALPTSGSKIIAAVELLSGGKILNIKNQTIYWYLNDTLIGGGTGVQQLTFPPFGAPPGAVTLKVELPSYNGLLLIHQIQIPLVLPQAVIYAPYPGNVVTTNPIAVTALPYFFNVASASDLSYVWSVNGQSGSNAENPAAAQINLPSGTPSGSNFSVALTIKAPTGPGSADASTDLIYQSSL